MIQDAFRMHPDSISRQPGAGCVFFLKNSLRDSVQRALTGFAAGGHGGGIGMETC